MSLFDLRAVELLACFLDDGVFLGVVGVVLGGDFQDGRDDSVVGVDLRSEVLLGYLVTLVYMLVDQNDADVLSRQKPLEGCLDLFLGGFWVSSAYCHPRPRSWTRLCCSALRCPSTRIRLPCLRRR